MEIERQPVDVCFTCRDCQQRWERSYEMRRWTDYEGDTVETYVEDGHPVPSPALGARCPACGSLRVDWAQARYAPRVATTRATAASKAAGVTARARRGLPGMFSRLAQREPRTRRFP